MKEAYLVASYPPYACVQCCPSTILNPEIPRERNEIRLSLAKRRRIDNTNTNLISDFYQRVGDYSLIRRSPVPNNIDECMNNADAYLELLPLVEVDKKKTLSKVVE